MISSIMETNNQVSKYVISSFDQNNMPINESVLQNVVYKIKMDLKNDHPLYESLPYYWYCNGPFSETLRQSFNSLKRFLKPVNDYFLLDNNQFDDSELGIVNEYGEIEDATWNLISKGDYVYSSLSKDIYKNLAPLDVLYTFKYDIFEPTYCESFIGDGDEYVQLFRDCQNQLFSLNDFNEFNLIFNNFIIQLDFLNEDDLICEKWNIIKQPIRNIWFAFSQGLRCFNHDSYYDDDFDDWSSIFKKSLSKLDIEIEHFVKSSDEWIDFSKYDEPTDEDKKFVNPLIDIYL